MDPSIEQLLHLLDLQQADEGVAHSTFVGPSSNEHHVRAFGGQVVAQALVAAGRTVDAKRQVNSFHSYFLRPGSPVDPIEYQVEAVRDGRSFSSRSVDAIQGGKSIFRMLASFHIDETGAEHSDAMPDVPKPDTLQPFEERFAGRDDPTDMARWFHRARPFDIRYVDASPFEPSATNHAAKQRVWIKAAPLPDDPLVHRAVLTYASDMTVLDAILLRHSIQWTDREVLGASLDHAVWFHQHFRADEWLLFDQESPIAHGGRGLARVKVWTSGGKLAITATQEALLRPPAGPSS